MGKAKREEVPATALEDQGPCRYSTAVRLAGYQHHSHFQDGVLLDELPYYSEVLRQYTADVRSESAPIWEQEHGRLGNPTVHIGLGQLRKLINTLIEKYGPPEEVVVELARDLKRSQDERKEIVKKQAENQDKNEQRKEKIAAAGISLRGDALLRMRLWEELSHDASDRRCVYSGQQISMAMLFSPEVEIEHILPFPRSLDDSPANLTVALRSANRLKRNSTPYEAFSSSPPGFDWPAIMVRVSALPKAKQWRFRHDALELVSDRMRREAARLEGSLPNDALDDIEKTGGFLARQLVDTAYLARLTRQYLWKICDPNKTWVIPGQMTALLRRKWGLNSLLSDHNQKTRTDHRHHAVDAFAVGMTDRSLLQRIATAASHANDRLLDDMPDPWNGFRDQLSEALDRIVISHRPDHAVQGQLHKENPYGVIGRDDVTGMYELVQRKNLTSLNDNEIERIRDRVIREELLERLGAVSTNLKDLRVAEKALEEARTKRDRDQIRERTAEVKRLREQRRTAKKVAKKALPPVLSAYAKEKGVHRIRLVTREASVIELPRKSGPSYKAYLSGENHRVEVYEKSDGTWGFEGINVFQANDPAFVPTWRKSGEGARLVMAVHKGDLLKIDHDGEERIFRVVKLAPTNRTFWLAEHFQAGNLQQRHDDPDDPFRWYFAAFSQLKERRARLIGVDLIGRPRDPGARK